ncbi:MAG: energy transducer TonB [Terracidiphilus sp.]
MRIVCFFGLILTAVLPGVTQTPANAAPGLPKDPHEIFAAAAPFYDFNSPELKPWHLKATYRLYDENGKPSEQGTFEYWWASPKVYRSSWTRPSATHSDWHMADGRNAHQFTGAPLEYFESNLLEVLLSPLPSSNEIDPSKYRLDQGSVGSRKDKSPCVMVVPLMPLYPKLQTVPLGLFPTYCFDSQLPVLRASHTFGNVTTGFNHIVKVQNRYLAREIGFYDGERKILSATVDSITNLSPTDPALSHPVEPIIPQTINTSGKKPEKVTISGGLMTGMLVKKVQPIYPQNAKDLHVSGTVVLQATIGRDGGVHNLRVISAPAPSLAISALWAVSRWQYKPYLLMGEPVEVDTTVNVIYTLDD